MRKATSNGGGAAAIAEPHQQMLLRLGESNRRADISAARRAREKEQLQQLLAEKQQQQHSEEMKCTRENRAKLLEFGVPVAADIIFEAATSTGDGGIDIGNNERNAEAFWSSVLPVAHASPPLHATGAADQQQQQQQDADRQIEIQQQTKLLLQQQKQDEEDKNQQNYSNMQWSTANMPSNDAAPRDHLSAAATLAATSTAAAAAAIVTAQPQGAAATTQGKAATVAAIQAAVIRAAAVQPSATSEAAATATSTTPAPAGGEDEMLHEAAAGAGEDMRAIIREDNEARVKVEEIIKEVSNDSTAAASSLAPASPAAASLLDYERQLDAWVVMTDTDMGCRSAAGGVTAADLSGRTAATADVILTAATAATAAAEDAAAEAGASLQGDCFPGIKQGDDTRTVTAATPTIAAASLTAAAAGDGRGSAITGEEGIAGETNDSKSGTDAIATAALKAKAAASGTAAAAAGTAEDMREEGGRAEVKEGGAPRAIADEGKTIEREKTSICASGTSQRLQEETRITKDDKSDVWKPWWSSLFKITALTEKIGSPSSGSSKGGGRSPVAGAACRGGESKQKQQKLKKVVVGERGASPKQQQQQQEEGITFSTERAGVFSSLQQQKRDAVEVAAAAKEQRDMRIEGTSIKNNWQKGCWCFSNSEEKQFVSQLYKSMPSSPTSAAAALCRPGEGCAAALSCPPSPIYYSSSAPSTGSGSCLSSIRVYTPSLPTPVLSRGLSSPAAAVATATQHTVSSSWPAASAAGRCWNPSSVTDILSPTSAATAAASISSAFLPAAADEEASPCDDSAFLSVDEQQLDMVFDKLLLSSAATAAAGGSPSSPIGVIDRAAATATRHTATIPGGSQSREACVVTASHINSKADNTSPGKADNSSPGKADNSFSDKAGGNSFSDKADNSFSDKADNRFCEKADSLCLSSLFTSRVTLDMKSPGATGAGAACTSSPFGDSPATTAAATGEDDSSFEEKEPEQQERYIEDNTKEEEEEEEIRNDEEGNEGGFGATLREKTLQLQQHLQRLHQGILDRDLPSVRLAIADLAEFGGPEVSGVWAGVKVGMGIATVATGHALVGGLMLAMATGAVGSAVIWGRHREYFRSWVVGMQESQSNQSEEGGEEGGREEGRGEGGGEEEIAAAAAIVAAAAAANEESEKREAFSDSSSSSSRNNTSSSNSNSTEIHATNNLPKTIV